MVVVVVTGTQGRVSTGGTVASGGVVVVVVVVVLVLVVGGDVVVSGTVVVVVGTSVLGGGEPASTEWPDMISGAATSSVANTARAAEGERRGIDIARVAAGPRGRRPPHHKLSVTPSKGLTHSTHMTGPGPWGARFWVVRPL